jgi:hypothetical protein
VLKVNCAAGDYSGESRTSRQSNSTELVVAPQLFSFNGEPMTVPVPFPDSATNREMLEAALAAGLQTGKYYTQRAGEIFIERFCLSHRLAINY